MKKSFNDIQIEIVRGDIANQPDMEAVVNAANAQLQTGGGVAGALHKAAGPQLAQAGEKYAPIKPGEAVLTEAFDLPNNFVIHCLGPVYGRDKPEDELLAMCYTNALQIAEQKQIKSIAFPALSTGSFGYPLEEATRITFDTVRNVLPNLKQINIIRFVLFGDRDLDVYENEMNKIMDSNFS